MKYLLAWAALLAGCYSPSDLRCKYRCAAGDTCPNNLTCNTTIGMCAASPDDMCDGLIGDADTDGPPSDGDVDVATVRDATSCDFPAIANVNPCADQLLSETTMPLASWEVVGVVNFNSDDFMGGPNATRHTMMVGAREVSIMVLGSLTIQPNSTLNITGTNPFIVLVRGDVQIRGRIVVGTSQSTTCAGVDNDGGDATAGGGGGAGGGGFGADGGNGGIGWQDGAFVPEALSNEVAGTAGVGGGHVSLNQLADLVPLRPGCPGGRGGYSGPMGDREGGGQPGRAGGAIQISAKGSITFDATGAIYAYGGGGGKAAGAPGASMKRSGGGGGGSGGAILLEAETVTVTNASLCTNGGGGGGIVAAGDPGDPFDDTKLIPACTVQHGGGGISNAISTENDTEGGNGGDAGEKKGNSVSGNAAQADTPGRGGGGGGGSVGIVRINADTIVGTTQATVGSYSSGVFTAP